MQIGLNEVYFMLDLSHACEYRVEQLAAINEERDCFSLKSG